MTDSKYKRCASCGSIHDRDEIPTASDPYTSDGTVEYCPDCREAEDFDEVKVHTMHDQTVNAWLAYFVDCEDSKVTPFKSGKTEMEAIDALLSAHLLINE